MSWTCPSPQLVVVAVGPPPSHHAYLEALFDSEHLSWRHWWYGEWYGLKVSADWECQGEYGLRPASRRHR